MCTRTEYSRGNTKLENVTEICSWDTNTGNKVPDVASRNKNERKGEGDETKFLLRNARYATLTNSTRRVRFVWNLFAVRPFFENLVLCLCNFAILPDATANLLAHCSDPANDFNSVDFATRDEEFSAKLGRPVKSVEEREWERNEKGRMTYHAHYDNALPIDRSFYAVPATWKRMSSDLITRYALPTLPSLNVSQRFRIIYLETRKEHVTYVYYTLYALYFFFLSFLNLFFVAKLRYFSVRIYRNITEAKQICYYFKYKINLLPFLNLFYLFKFIHSNFYSTDVPISSRGKRRIVVHGFWSLVTVRGTSCQRKRR